MLRLFCASCLLLSSLDLLAQISVSTGARGSTAAPALSHYRVVKGWPVKEAIPALNEGAAQGYRLLLTGKLAIMRLDTQPPDIYRYMALPDAGIFASFMNSVNQQGAYGYRWVATTRFMEKEPHPHNYEYETIEGFKAGTREESRRTLISRGFVPVGSYESRPMFMHELDAAPPSPSRRAYMSKFVEMASERKAMKDITKLAQQGYRYIGPDFPPNGNALRMEKCEEDCGGPFEYREISAKDPEQLQHDLNDAAGEGFHLVSRSFEWRPNLMERGRDRTPGFEYRVGEADEAASTQRFVEAGDQDGFVPIAFAAHVGWNVHVFLILEKSLMPE